MKIKKNLLIGLAAFAFLACNDDKQSSENEPNGALKGYITLNITAPQTKTIGSVTDPGLPQESDISSVTIVLTNSTGAVSETVQVGIDPTAAPNLKTVPAQVTAGVYFVYALVNYSGTTLDLVGNLIQKIIDVESAAEATSGYKDGSFFMVNEYNGIPVLGTPAGGIAATIGTNHNTAANALEVPVKVDRVAIKVVDATATPTVTGLVASGGSIFDGANVTGFVPLNINKQFNIIQKWENIAADRVLSTPLFVANNVDNISSQYWLNIGEYTQLDKSGTPSEIVGITDKTAGNAGLYVKGPVYMTENRPPYILLTNGEYTAGKGETSAVIYRVQTTSGGGNAPTFYKFLNLITTDFTIIKSQPTFTDNDIVQNTPDSPTSTDFPALRANGIQVYEDGVMYYTYFIKDVNTNHQLGGQDYYSVFRNSFYSLTINSIDKIGDDVPGGSINPVDPDPSVPTDPTDPTDPTNPPIDKEEAYITVTITINPWVLNTIGIEF